MWLLVSLCSFKLCDLFFRAHLTWLKSLLTFIISGCRSSSRNYVNTGTVTTGSPWCPYRIRKTGLEIFAFVDLFVFRAVKPEPPAAEDASSRSSGYESEVEIIRTSGTFSFRQESAFFINFYSRYRYGKAGQENYFLCAGFDLLRKQMCFIQSAEDCEVGEKILDTVTKLYENA